MKIAEPAIKEYREFLNSYTGDKVVDILAKNNLALNERYYLFVFENNSEDKFHNRIS
ncbi:MAG: hypothetical protein ACOWWO_03830 [Peptococcaceae bacterium]